MKGKIIKGIAGFYYVHDGNVKTYECKAKGIFRNQKIKPLVGDDVEIDILDENEGIGNIIRILPRRNALIRPAVANVDQALIVFAGADPDPNLNLLDRFLIMMGCQDVPVTICFNKVDLISEDEREALRFIYETAGYPVHFTSICVESKMEDIKTLIRGKTTVLAGPSGVGKSSITNLLQPEANMAIGAISEKIKRGKHTTRHSELFFIEQDTYMMDTPGFSSLYLEEMAPEDLKNYFPEFAQYQEECRFLGCIHDKEPVCGVKQSLEKGLIGESRYHNYIMLYRELKDKRRY